MDNAKHITRKEIETVIRTEVTQRIKDEMEGEAEGSPSIIREYQAQILLACTDRHLAYRYFELLEKATHRFDFVQVYEAGKESAKKGESLHKGFYRYLREFAMNFQNQEFDNKLLTVFTLLSKQIPNKEVSLLPWYLFEEYRKTYGMVDSQVDHFFKMGYDAAINEVK